MKFEDDGQVLSISEGRFLPRFVRYFAACSILGGLTMFGCAIMLVFEKSAGFFQITLALALSVAAICYGVYLLFLFPDVRVTLDKKGGKASITQRRMFDKHLRELELRRITGLVIERSEGSTGNSIYRIAFRTYKGELIPLSGSWTEDGEHVESDARKIHASLDPNCALDLPASLKLAKQSVPKDVIPGQRSASKPDSDRPLKNL